MSHDDSTAPESAPNSSSADQHAGDARRVPVLVGLALLLVAGVIAFVVVALLGAGVALTRGQAALALRGAALVLLVITTGWGLGGSAQDMRTIVG